MSARKLTGAAVASVLVVIAALATGCRPIAQIPLPDQPAPAQPRQPDSLDTGASVAVGQPWRGRLVNGVLLPAAGRDFFTWDPVRRRIPNRPWRRWGTDRLVQTVRDVLRRYRAAHPGAPRVGIGDLSRPHGGIFDERFGGLGHNSHQNGRDIDIYYPRLDRREERPSSVAQVDRRLAQDLISAFVEAGAQFVFVGRRMGFRGPRAVVQAIPHHRDHLHVRIHASAPRG